MEYHLCDYLLLVSDHDANFSFVKNGPIILDHIPDERPYFSLPDIANLCLPQSLPDYDVSENTSHDMIKPPSYHISTFYSDNIPIFLCCMRFDQLIYRESGNNIWNVVNSSNNQDIVSTIVHYSLCIVSHYPMYSYGRVLLSYMLQFYVYLPNVPSSPFHVSCDFASPVHFTGIKAHCSFSSFTSIILEMMGLPVGKMSKLLLPDISFPITPSNSLLLPGMADLVMKASFSSFSIKMLLELFKYLFLNGRIVIISSDISLLSLALEGLRTLLFPFEWKPPFLYISILLTSQLSLLQSQSSFLIGLPRDFLVSPIVSDAYASFHLVIDIDNQTIHYPSNRNLFSFSFPSSLVKELNTKLNRLIPPLPTLKDAVIKTWSMFYQEVSKWREKRVEEIFDCTGNGDPFVYSYSTSFPPFEPDDRYVSEWIDIARTIILEFFFKFFGMYESFIQDRIFHVQPYLLYVHNNPFITAIIKKPLFQSHIIELIQHPDSRMKLLIEGKRQYLQDFNHDHLYELCKRSPVLPEEVIYDERGLLYQEYSGCPSLVPVFHCEDEIENHHSYLHSPLEIENMNPFLQEQQLECLFKRMVKNEIESNEENDSCICIKKTAENEKNNLLFYHPVLSKNV